MATRNRGNNDDVEHVSSNEKIARLLALLVTKDLDQKTDQVVLLRRIGFSIGEVAAILGMTANHVNVATHMAKRRTQKVKK